MKKLVLLLASLLLACPAAALADEFQVAVAANFTAPSKDIAAEFEKETGHRAVLSFDSTGNFYAQIKNGAPFTLLLAADSATPAKLEEEGGAKPGSRFTYAQGALALWSAREGYVDSQGEVLKGDQFKFLAVADPKLAPYGAAAYELLDAWKLTAPLQSAQRIVTGNNIGQAFQLTESGQAELGLIAWSQVCRDGQLSRGSVWLVPADLYSPILQDAVILKSAADNAVVQAFADYLKNSPKAREIILSYGYTLP
ncbi:MAG: molybdate ABC transporter substrate-binding protein [Candidatus Adiutrix sp.]|jgi:molybdate transport system substrate-binding protein|nr:molybdate ABC transporter substrate-binding protein [Candidatus Adiutrix sp.]